MEADLVVARLNSGNPADPKNPLDRERKACYSNCTNTDNTVLLNGGKNGGGEMISLNYRDSRPIYEQIKDELRKLIVTGALAAEEKLPSVRSLATQLSINPNTIQRAYNDLEAEGYIYSVPGKGSFASDRGSADAARRDLLLDKVRELLAELRVLGVTKEEMQMLLKEGKHSD